MYGWSAVFRSYVCLLHTDDVVAMGQGRHNLRLGLCVTLNVNGHCWQRRPWKGPTGRTMLPLFIIPSSPGTPAVRSSNYSLNVSFSSSVHPTCRSQWLYLPLLLLSVSSPSSICHSSFAFQLLFRYFNFVITPAPIFFLYYCQCCTPFNTPWIKCIACASNPDFGLCMSVDQCLTSRSYVPQDTTILIAWILGSLRLRTPHESSPGFSHHNSLDLVRSRGHISLAPTFPLPNSDIHICITMRVHDIKCIGLHTGIGKRQFII